MFSKLKKILFIVAIFAFALAFACACESSNGVDDSRLNSQSDSNSISQSDENSDSSDISISSSDSALDSISDGSGESESLSKTVDKSKMPAPTSICKHVMSVYPGVQPTCDHVGYKAYAKCDICGFSTRVDIPALPHTVGDDFIVETEATCEHAGSKYKICSVCQNHVETEEIPQLEHLTGDFIVETAATCQKVGSQYKECSLCHKHVDTEEIPQLEHNYVYDICTNCGFEKYLEISDDKYVTFGSYPQTRVDDYQTIQALNESSGGNNVYNIQYIWNGFGYYSSSNYNASLMYYTNVTYNNAKYFGIYINNYRPTVSTKYATSNYSKQDENGYYTGMVYWFKYEPLKWRIISQSGAQSIILCENIIDGQMFNYSTYYSSVYANNYANSPIRSWLNNSFYNSAFSPTEQAAINSYDVDNSASTTISSSNSYASNNTTDKVFLLSYQDVFNKNYGFSINSNVSTNRMKACTDYAMCQGVPCVGSNAGWYLRSPHTFYTRSSIVSDAGNLSYTYVNYVYGIVPALKVNTSSLQPIQTQPQG